jgi:hypothetical protein
MSATLLNEAYEKIASSHVREGMEDLFNGLKDCRRSLDKKDWISWVQTEALTHPLCNQIHSDPFTYRSFAKPRGYAGDGVLIDMVYKHGCVDMEAITPVGKEIYEITSNAPAAKAVRNRREHIARLIDSVAKDNDRAAVLALACGHLRECELSHAVQARGLGRYVAVDQDAKNLVVIRRDYAHLQITARESSLRDIVTGSFNGERFDLIYTAGLYDYLPNPVAKMLTSVLFDMLSLGGTLFVANFLPEIRDAGYMESYMAWKLIYRTENEMIDLIEEVAQDRIDYVDVVTEPEGNIACMTLGRRGLGIAW